MGAISGEIVERNEGLERGAVLGNMLRRLSGSKNEPAHEEQKKVEELRQVVNPALQAPEGQPSNVMQKRQKPRKKSILSSFNSQALPPYLPSPPPGKQPEPVAKKHPPRLGSRSNTES
jgi:hypothetical protein